MFYLIIPEIIIVSDNTMNNVASLLEITEKNSGGKSPHPLTQERGFWLRSVFWRGTAHLGPNIAKLCVSDSCLYQFRGRCVN